MTSGAPGKIIGTVAMIGLGAVILAFLWFKVHPPAPGRGTGADYDRVFKYCMNADDGDGNAFAAMRSHALYARVNAMTPGDYLTGDGGGHLYLLGSGMFQISLPSQLQVVRSFGGDAKASSSTQNPESIIGCTSEELVKAMEVYSLEPGPLFQPLNATNVKGAS